MKRKDDKQLGFKQMLAGLEANSMRAAKLPKTDPSLPRISSYACDDPVVHRAANSPNAWKLFAPDGRM
jgi:hypothetical protein